MGGRESPHTPKAGHGTPQGSPGRWRGCIKLRRAQFQDRGGHHSGSLRSPGRDHKVPWKMEEPGLSVVRENTGPRAGSGGQDPSHSSARSTAPSLTFLALLRCMYDTVGNEHMEKTKR